MAVTPLVSKGNWLPAGIREDCVCAKRTKRGHTVWHINKDNRRANMCVLGEGGGGGQNGGVGHATGPRSCQSVAPWVFQLRIGPPLGNGTGTQTHWNMGSPVKEAQARQGPQVLVGIGPTPRATWSHPQKGCIA